MKTTALLSVVFTGVGIIGSIIPDAPEAIWLGVWGLGLIGLSVGFRSRFLPARGSAEAALVREQVRQESSSDMKSLSNLARPA